MKKLIAIVCCCLMLTGVLKAQKHAAIKAVDKLQQAFLHPPESAKPWVLWYWMQASITKAGITADLEAMKKEGLAGAYLVSIKGPANPPYINPPVQQLTPEWWGIVKFAMQEADRLGLKLAMHDCDGFALAGGPWITPELSMQKIVSSRTIVNGGRKFSDTLLTPAHYKDYYRDIKVLAFPAAEGTGITSSALAPKVTTSSPNTDVQFLADPANKKNFTTNEPCWIQLAFDKPFTCRSLVIKTNAPNFQSERLAIEVSEDGEHFHSIGRLQPPRHGWQDADVSITNSIPAVTAKYFRFLYDKEGTEPGSEDIDFAKWKPTLKISGIELSSEAKLNQFEGKTGEVWRVSKRTTNEQLPEALCIPKEKIIDLTAKLDKNGRLDWDVPPGSWVILRIGHTSTGHTNATGGAGSGLECDKFNPAAIKLQFDNWFGEAFKQGGPGLAKKVLKIFYIDSWECGSQNWSGEFAAEFKKRRGYDLLPYLPVMAGYGVENANVSEKVLSDVRQTITELVKDKFYDTLAKLAKEKGCIFTAESVAPTMVSDGMLHYSKVDIPMGEFWLRSPTHDKPNDMLDAISGGHIYGKNVIAAEAFTELRTMWDENPAMLKPILDRNFALGINRAVFHVDVLNPWLDRKPGMTLDGIGHFFQRDQTWYKPGKAWIAYVQRCQALLQSGRPVADVAVFTGEETPRRAMLPDRLVSALPGIFGEERVKSEAERLANKGVPMRIMPVGVSHTANIADPEKWVDPLRGYAYDSFNKDVLLQAKVKDGRIVLPGGATYGVLVIPGNTPMNPDAGIMSAEVLQKLIELAKAGAHIILAADPKNSPGMGDDRLVKQLGDQLSKMKSVSTGVYRESTFDQVGIARDVIVNEAGKHAEEIAWTHRHGEGFDIYFISNQQNKGREILLSLRLAGRIPELWDPVTGTMKQASVWVNKSGRTELPLKLEQSGSVLVVLRNPANQSKNNIGNNWASASLLQTLPEKWSVQFDKSIGGPQQPVEFNRLTDWSTNSDDRIKHYSGTAVYTQNFTWNGKAAKGISLSLGTVDNIADVYMNGVFCGTAWTAPYRVDISKALKPGVNQLRIEVTNTWANRLKADHDLPENKRITWTNARYYLDGQPLLPAGLLGPVQLLKIVDR